MRRSIKRKNRIHDTNRAVYTTLATAQLVLIRKTASGFSEKLSLRCRNFLQILSRETNVSYHYSGQIKPHLVTTQDRSNCATAQDRSNCSIDQIATGVCFALLYRSDRSDSCTQQDLYRAWVLSFNF